MVLNKINSPSDLKKITIEELSKTFYFNKDYIMRVFKREIKSTIIEYINKKTF